MNTHSKKKLYLGLIWLAVFLLWTVTISSVDVQAVGPRESTVGLASLNKAFHDLTGVHLLLYAVTDRLSLIPLGCAVGFSLLGLAQWLGRKRLSNVDRSILILGGYYIFVAAVHGFFEWHVINYRPILIDGVLEASYPSSTTTLVLTIMPTTIMQLNTRVKNSALKRGIVSAISIFIGFMVIGRLISGVHWLSDIIGGVFLSAGCVMLYAFFAE